MNIKGALGVDDVCLMEWGCDYFNSSNHGLHHEKCQKCGNFWQRLGTGKGIFWFKCIFCLNFEWFVMKRVICSRQKTKFVKFQCGIATCVCLMTEINIVRAACVWCMSWYHRSLSHCSNSQASDSIFFCWNTEYFAPDACSDMQLSGNLCWKQTGQKHHKCDGFQKIPL